MNTVEDEIDILNAYSSDDEPEATEDTETKAEAEIKKDDSYATIHASGFREFLLKPELLRAIIDCGFEHPSEVQNECIPQAILGTDVICQARSGMGKTAVFVLSTLQQIDATRETGVKCLVLCNTRELAYQICHEFDRFRKYLPAVKTAVLYGGIPVNKHRTLLKENTPHIVIGTPGRILQLCNEKALDLSKLRHFILDECDKMLETLGIVPKTVELFVRLDS